jgi:hypothetical protein
MRPGFKRKGAKAAKEKEGRVQTGLTGVAGLKKMEAILLFKSC